MKQDNLIYGIRPLIEAIEAGKEIDKILIQKGLRGNLIDELFTLIKQFEIPYQYVPIEKLNRITRKNHQGIISFTSEIEYSDISMILPDLFEKGINPFILILDRITDVRNMGAVARTAECAGINAIILPIKDSAQINADAMKTSAGALNKIPVHRSKNLLDTIKFLRSSGLKIVACTEKAQKPYHEIDYNDPVAIVVGSEENGISNDIIRISDEIVTIPMAGEIASLNVSVAAGIIMFEAFKQRSSK